LPELFVERVRNDDYGPRSLGDGPSQWLGADGDELSLCDEPSETIEMVAILSIVAVFQEEVVVKLDEERGSRPAEALDERLDELGPKRGPLDEHEIGIGLEERRRLGQNLGVDGSTHDRVHEPTEHADVRRCWMAASFSGDGGR
jgi:hypothetical protein